MVAFVPLGPPVLAVLLHLSWGMDTGVVLRFAIFTLVPFWGGSWLPCVYVMMDIVAQSVEL